MANKQVMELVIFVEKAYTEKWGYVWGASGEVYDKTVAQKLYNLYGNSKYDKTYFMTTQMNLWANKKVADCSGLIRAFNGNSVTAHDLYSQSKEKGLLKNFNNHIGYLVFCVADGVANHVGVITGNSYVIHSTNSQKGVIKEKLATSTRGWTHYGKASFIDYTFAEPVKCPVVSGASVNDVCFLQTLLNKQIGAGLEVDGAYGKLTDGAKTKFIAQAAKFVK